MNTVTSKVGGTTTAWCWLVFGFTLGISSLVGAIQSDNIGLALSGCGFLILGIVWFSYHPISLAAPLIAQLRSAPIKMTPGTAQFRLLGVVLLVVGLVLRWAL